MKTTIGIIQGIPVCYNRDNTFLMKIEENTILNFEDTKSGVLAENLGFSIILGKFGYFCAIMGTVSLILQLLERRRKRGNSKK